MQKYPFQLESMTNPRNKHQNTCHQVSNYAPKRKKGKRWRFAKHFCPLCQFSMRIHLYKHTDRFYQRIWLMRTLEKKIISIFVSHYRAKRKKLIYSYRIAVPCQESHNSSYLLIYYSRDLRGHSMLREMKKMMMKKIQTHIYTKWIKPGVI